MLDVFLVRFLWQRIAEELAAQHSIPNARNHIGQTDAGMLALYTSRYMRAQASFFFHHVDQEAVGTTSMNLCWSLFVAAHAKQTSARIWAVHVCLSAAF